MAQIALNLPDMWHQWLKDDCKRLKISQQRAVRDLLKYMLQGIEPSWLDSLRRIHALERVTREPN